MIMAPCVRVSAWGVFRSFSKSQFRCRGAMGSRHRAEGTGKGERLLCAQIKGRSNGVREI